MGDDALLQVQYTNDEVECNDNGEDNGDITTNSCLVSSFNTLSDVPIVGDADATPILPDEESELVPDLEVEAEVIVKTNVHDKVKR